MDNLPDEASRPPPAPGTIRRVSVIATVPRDTRRRVLLARRTEGRELAGLWEFPGGKVEPGEAPEAALIRELHEELGVRATVGEAVLCVSYDTPGRRLLLDVRDVTVQGRPRGLEGQALAWVPLARLREYPMPPADKPVVDALLRRSGLDAAPQAEASRR